MLMSFATIFSYCVCAAVSLKVLDFQRISDDVEKDVISTATADSGILLPSSFVICTSHYQKRINASFNSIFVLYADEQFENRWFSCVEYKALLFYNSPLLIPPKIYLS